MKTLEGALLHALLLAALLTSASAQEPVQFLTQMALSPDGKTVAFAWRGDLWRGEIKGGAIERLTTDPGEDSQPAFSPNGETLAFISNRSGSNQIWTMPATGGAAVQRTQNTDGYELVSWMPDGQGFFVRANRDHAWRDAARFFVQPLDGTKAPTLLFDDYGSEGSLSPNGRWLLFQREGAPTFRKMYYGSQAGQVWIYDLGNKSFTELHRDPHGSRSPLFGPNEDFYYYLSQESGAFNVIQVDRSKGTKKPMTFFEDDGVYFPAISRNGQTMVYMRAFKPYHLDLNSGVSYEIEWQYTGEPIVAAHAKMSLDRASEAAFTSDGREIAFIAAGDVFVMDTELKEPVRVTTTPEEERDLLWSKDFETLYFVSDVSGEAEIWTARRADPELHFWQNERFILKRITESAEVESGLGFFPDNSRITYFRGTSLWSMKPDGTDQKPLIESWSRLSYAISPDSKWIAYSHEDDDYNDDVWIRRIDGSEPAFNLSAHPDDDRGPVWSADGKFLAFVGRRWAEEWDIVWVPLQKETIEKTDRDERMEKAIEKMKGRKGKANNAPANNAAKSEPAPKEEKPESEEQHPLAGTWRGLTKGPLPLPPAGVPFEMVLTIAKDGKISGTAKSPMGSMSALDYAFDRVAKTFEITFDSEGERLLVMGRIDGNKTNGTWKMGPMEGTFEAERVEAPKAPESAANAGKTKPESKPAKDDKTVKVEIDFDGIRDRLRRVSIPDSFESGLVFGPKDAVLYFQATVSGKRGTYSINLPKGTTPQESRIAFSFPGEWIDDGKLWASNSGGRPTTTALSGNSTSYGFQVRMERDLGAHNAVILDQAWRAMRDGWYDERLGNKNWDEVRRKYRAAAALTRTPSELSLVGNAMLGELNGSHLGFRPGNAGGAPVANANRLEQWREVTGHLGARFDANWKGPGLKIKDVIDGTPATREASRLFAGEVIHTIDGMRVDPSMDPSVYLHGIPGLERELEVEATDGARRKVKITPTSSGAVRGRLYAHWIEENRQKVEALSKGQLGYAHIAGMGGGNLLTFDEELHKVAAGKDGLIIDVRENGGGSIADHLLTMLCQPTHAITRARGSEGTGYPQDRRIYATWSKPIVVLCNQNSFSNAEIFSHAIKQLKRGRVLGVPTAGGVISTGSATLFDNASVRMPFRGWYTLDGEDMELNGCVPDIVIWPEPGEMPAGKDRQLEAAVQALTEDVQAWKARPSPRLKKATERTEKPR